MGPNLFAVAFSSYNTWAAPTTKGKLRDANRVFILGMETSRGQQTMFSVRIRLDEVGVMFVLGLG